MSDHWDRVWESRDPEAVTWFQASPDVSMRLIAAVARPGDRIIDVGGGASRLVDHLLAAGYDDVTVLDIAAGAMAAARRRLGGRAAEVRWVVADVTDTAFDTAFDVWHDRAVFHFLTEPDGRAGYLAGMNAALAVGGHVVLSTFGPDGPEWCSGLPVLRYDVATLHATLGDGYALVADEVEHHVTPTGATQQFVYGVFRRLR